MIDEKRRENFLKELAELSRKHEIIIGGCGCCSSPYLYELKNIEDLDKGYYKYEKGNTWTSEIEWKVDISI